MRDSIIVWGGTFLFRKKKCDKESLKKSLYIYFDYCGTCLIILGSVLCGWTIFEWTNYQCCIR